MNFLAIAYKLPPNAGRDDLIEAQSPTITDGELCRYKSGADVLCGWNEKCEVGDRLKRQGVPREARARRRPPDIRLRARRSVIEAASSR